MDENVITKQDRVRDWREKCCNQCRYKFTKYEGKQYQCDFSKSTDEDVLEFNELYGCQGIREQLETGIFSERARKHSI